MASTLKLAYAGVGLDLDVPFARPRILAPSGSPYVPATAIDWIHKNYDPAYLRMLLKPPLWPGPKQTELGTPQWPEPPPFGFGRLFWPWGASRFGFTYVLASDDILDQFADAGSFDTSSPNTFTLQSDTSKLEAQLFLLPPRPISTENNDPNATQDRNRLYILPLVDRRYFWRTLDSGNIVINQPVVDSSEPTSWEDLLDQIGDAIDKDIDYGDDIEDVYGNPHHSLTSKYTNVAVLLDAVAYSLGRRVVMGLDDTVSLMTASENADALTDNTLPYPRAGGNSQDARDDLDAAAVPESVTVGFQWVGAARAIDEIYTITPGADTDDTNEQTVTILTTGQAYDDKSESLANMSQISALAGQISSDFYGWLDFRDDVVTSGIHSLEPLGADLLWTYSADDCSSRIIAAPYLRGDSLTMFHSFGVDAAPRSFLAQLDAGDSGNYTWHQVYEKPDGTLATSVSNAPGTMTGSAHNAFYLNGAARSIQSGIVSTTTIVRLWRGSVPGNETQYFFEAPARTIYGTISGGGSTMAISGTLNGPSPGSSVSIQNTLSTFTLSNGLAAMAVEDIVSGSWFLVFVACPPSD